MNWKKEAEDKLKSLDARRRALESLPEQIREQELGAAAIRSAMADGAPVKGGGSGREDAMLNNMCYREELGRQLKQTRLWVASVERALEALTAEEKLILDRFYIHPARGKAERLCELGLEKTQVYARRDRALRRFTIALYGFEDS